MIRVSFINVESDDTSSTFLTRSLDAVGTANNSMEKKTVNAPRVILRRAILTMWDVVMRMLYSSFPPLDSILYFPLSNKIPLSGGGRGGSCLVAVGINSSVGRNVERSRIAYYRTIISHAFFILVGGRSLRYQSIIDT